MGNVFYYEDNLGLTTEYTYLGASSTTTNVEIIGNSILCPVFFVTTEGPFSVPYLDNVSGPSGTSVENINCEFLSTYQFSTSAIETELTSTSYVPTWDSSNQPNIEPRTYYGAFTKVPPYYIGVVESLEFTDSFTISVNSSELKGFTFQSTSAGGIDTNIIVTYPASSSYYEFHTSLTNYTFAQEIQVDALQISSYRMDFNSQLLVNFGQLFSSGELFYGASTSSESLTVEQGLRTATYEYTSYGFFQENFEAFLIYYGTDYYAVSFENRPPPSFIGGTMALASYTNPPFALLMNSSSTIRALSLYKPTALYENNSFNTLWNPEAFNAGVPIILPSLGNSHFDYINSYGLSFYFGQNNLISIDLDSITYLTTETNSDNGLYKLINSSDKILYRTATFTETVYSEITATRTTFTESCKISFTGALRFTEYTTGSNSTTSMDTGYSEYLNLATTTAEANYENLTTSASGSDSWITYINYTTSYIIATTSETLLYANVNKKIIAETTEIVCNLFTNDIYY